MRTYNLSKKASEDFLRTVWLQSPSLRDKEIPKAKDIKIAELDDPTLAILFQKDLRLYFGRRNDKIFFPLLRDEQVLPTLATATVDMGAIKFVCNGANVMRPGILSFEGGFEKGSLIVVKEASHSKAIAVGRAMEAKESTLAMTKGPAIENLHYVGDKFWEALKIIEQ